MTLHPSWFGLADATDAVRWSFVSVGIWWFVFALPCALWVHETAGRGRYRPARQSAGLLELRATTELTRYRPVLVPRSVPLHRRREYHHQDGGRLRPVAGFPASGLVAALLLTQFVAFQRRWPLGGSADVSAAAASSSGSRSTPARRSVRTASRSRDFYTLAVIIGLVQGGVQSLSRSYFGRLVPEGKSSEFFGFYNMMGEASAVAVDAGRPHATATGSSRASICPSSCCSSAAAHC
jgi:UMF1 family MFS transporter